MSVLPCPPQPVQPLTPDQQATYQRIVETALRTGYTQNEAEQIADDWLRTGEVVP